MFSRYIVTLVYISLCGVNTKQLKTKNRKLRKLIEVSYRHKPYIFTIPIKNLSSSDIDVSNLKGKGMNYSFVDKEQIC